MQFNTISIWCHKILGCLLKLQGMFHAKYEEQNYSSLLQVSVQLYCILLNDIHVVSAQFIPCSSLFYICQWCISTHLICPLIWNIDLILNFYVYKFQVNSQEEDVLVTLPHYIIIVKIMHFRCSHRALLLNYIDKLCQFIICILVLMSFFFKFSKF